MPKTVTAALFASALLTLNVQASDLLQVYKEALSNDAYYGSAHAALAASREKLPQGRAGLLPSIDVAASSSRTNSNFAPDGALNLNQTYHNENYRLSFTQPLFNWANWEQFELSKLIVSANEALFAQTQQDLIVRVAQAYFDMLAAHDMLDSNQAQKKAITEQLASAKRNFDVGTQTITGTHEAQARYDLIVAQEFSARNDLETKRSALQQIIGRFPDPLAVLKAGVKLNSPSPATIEPWMESAEKKNYGVINSQFSLEIAKRNISKNRGGHLPTINLFANANRGNTNGSSQFGNSSRSNAQVVGVELNMPLFSGFAMSSKVREAIALENKSRNDLEAAKRSAKQIARVSYFGINFGLAQVKALEAAEVSSQAALDLNLLEYQVGGRINIDILNAQQQLYSSRMQLAKARYDTIMNGLKLKSAAGNLSEEDLTAVNALLDSTTTTSPTPVASAQDVMAD